MREELNEGRVDVAIAPAPIEVDDRIVARALYSEPRVLVVPSSHRLADRDAIDIREVSDEVFVVASGGAPAIIDWWLVDPRPDGSHPRQGRSPTTSRACSSSSRRAWA